MNKKVLNAEARNQVEVVARMCVAEGDVTVAQSIAHLLELYCVNS